MFYKRKIIALCLIALLVLSTFSGCSSAVKSSNDEEIEEEFTPYTSVNFIDLGCGESIFILFGDGKSMLVDCGKDKTDGDKVVEYLKKFKVEKLDYLVLTHPDSEHIGGVETVIDQIKVEKVFHPNVKDRLLPLYPSYNTAITKLSESGAELNVSKCFKNFKGDNYTVLFLSPIDGENNSYLEFNSSKNPTEKQADNVSPIIYVDINGVRFLLTGDANAEQEKAVEDNVKVSIYQMFLSNAGLSVNLDGIDFLKVSKGGDKCATSADFANFIKAKNAVVFSGEGRYPENVVINNLTDANSEFDLWRTDVYGTVSVKIEDGGLYTVITEKEQND